MLITKHEQACLTVTVEDETIIIDPGTFTETITVGTPLIAVVFTHEHVDHVNPSLLHKLLEQHPEAKVYAPASVTAQLDDVDATTVHPHDTIDGSPFTLTFTGGVHAVILPGISPVENVGVLINDELYYPGDSYALPPHAVDTLALPTSGPWFKLSDSVAFAAQVNPRQVFPTHDYLNSEPGSAIVERWLHEGLDPLGIEVVPLAIGGQLEIPDRPLKLA